MLTSRLCWAQVELQSHRQWLRTFITRRQLHNSTRSVTNHVLNRQDARPWSTRVLSRETPNDRCTYATKRLKLIRHAAKEAEKAKGPPPELLALREAVRDLRIHDVAQIYHSFEDKRIIRSKDFYTIAQCLHHIYRNIYQIRDQKQRRDETEVLVTLAEELVKDVKRGYLVPNDKAHVHLISFFKEAGVRDAGIEFWRWLEMQDDTFVSVDVYGAAIELLAVSGTTLPELEELYKQALSRFPGSFSAYHLSPEGIIPDRDQATTLKGIPISLLQGILTARLLHGDTRNAYLALDTALRLYPDQVPARFFALFLEERPLLEAYTVFAIACRGGIVIPMNQFRRYLTAMRACSDLSSPARHALAVRSILSAMYMYISVGGRLTQNIINELVIVVTQFMRLKGVAHIEAKKKQQLVHELMDVIRSALSVFARYGARPGLSPFNSIITNLGGHGHSKQIIGIALSDARALGFEPNEVTRRSILTAAGNLKDTDFVSKAWKDLLHARHAAGQVPDSTDWHCFIKAAHQTGQVDFARAEFEVLRYQSSLIDPSMIEWSLEDVVHNSEAQKDGAEALDVSNLLDEVKKIRADVSVVDERTKDSPKTQDLRDQQLPMRLLPMPSKLFSLSEREMVGIYDELTTEQRSPRPARGSVDARSVEVDALSDDDNHAVEADLTRSNFDSDTSPKAAVTSTNMPFGVLRYENWKTINWLLEQAELSDQAYLRGVDKAIATGTMPPQRTLALTIQGMDSVESYGLSHAIRPEKRSKRVTVTPEEAHKVREHILRLRGRQP